MPGKKRSEKTILQGGDFQNEDFLLIASRWGRVLFTEGKRINGQAAGQLHRNAEWMSEVDRWEAALSLR